VVLAHLELRFDTADHEFDPDDRLWLCCVEIPGRVDEAPRRGASRFMSFGELPNVLRDPFRGVVGC
jgi:hypothetical protein